jgi:tetratricopeptide (TPR) repeat protein
MWLILALVLGAAPAAGGGDDTAAALAAYRAGRCEEAVPLLGAVLAREPGNTTLRKLLASCHLRAGRAAEARAEFSRVLATTPEDGDAQEGLRLAVASMQTGEQARQGALLESRAAAELRLESQGALRRAESLIASGRRDEAEPALTAILERDPGFLLARQRLAELYSAMARFADAARLYRALYRDEPGRHEWLLRAAKNLEWGRETAAAAAAYREYLTLHPAERDVRLALATMLRQFSFCAEALPEYAALAKEQPRDVRPQLGVALCEDQLGHAERAIEAYQRVLAMDPRNAVALRARERRARDFDELPRRKARAAIEAGDLREAAARLEEFVATHPAANDARRELADVYSWAGRYAEAEACYREYLSRQPADSAVLRALARLQSWSGRLAAARATYETVVASRDAQAGDLEELVRVLSWSGEPEAAEPHARRLLELDRSNATAQKILEELRTRRLRAARENAERLQAQRRFPEARAAYDAYLNLLGGEDLETELRLCDMYEWAGDHAAAIAAYRAFLGRHPAELRARLALANTLRWTGDAPAAEAEYRLLLERQPDHVEALVGLAQVMEKTTDDPFRVAAAYDRVLAVDSSNGDARRGRAALRPRVTPMLAAEERGFSDSDGLRSSRLSLEAAFPLPGLVRLTPSYRLRYYHQRRELRGGDAATAAINTRVARNDGTWNGQELALRAEIGSDRRWRALGEAGFVSYGSDQKTPYGRVELLSRFGVGGTVTASWRHDDAISEVYTVASLAAQMTANQVAATVEQPLVAGLRGWVAGGLTWYSAGSAEGVPDAFAANRQYRVNARLFRPIGAGFRFGYSFRQTGFRDRSPLFFSPDTYWAHTLWLAAERRGVSRFDWRVDAEGGLAQIDGERSGEWAVLLDAGWRLDERLRLTASGRVSRSSSGLEPGRRYRTEQFQLGLARSF